MVRRRDDQRLNRRSRRDASPAATGTAAELVAAIDSTDRLAPCPPSWEAVIQAIVDAAPPVTAEQRARLLFLVRGNLRGSRAAA
jgi:hypothetical protein